MIDWSYDLLSEKEKILWSRLSVFAGGWTLEAAEEVCSDQKIKKEEGLELLNQLTEKSIIIFEKEKERYRILESLKQYGEEKLKETKESNEILSKHLYHYMEYSETSEPKLKGSEIHIWLKKLDQENNNFQSAIEWSLSGGDKEKGARLAGALGHFWDIRGQYSNVIMLKKILHKEQGISKSSLGKSMYWAGSLTTIQGDYDEAVKFLEKSLALRRDLGDKRDLADPLHALGTVSCYLGHSETAQKFLDESLALFYELGDKHGIANSFNSLGNVAYIQGNYNQAQKYYEECLTLTRHLSDKIGIATALTNLGNVVSSQGNYKKAQMYYGESLALRRELGEKRGIAMSLSDFGILAYHYGNYKKAKKFLEESLTLFHDLGYKRGMAFSLNKLGDVAYFQEDYKQAQRYYEECFTLNRQMGDKIGIADSLNNLGNLELSAGNNEQAQKLFAESLELRYKIKDKLGIAYSLIGLARILSTGNNMIRAVLLLGVVEATLKSMGIVLESTEQKNQKKLINKLHEKLSDEEFSKYFEKGKMLTLEQATELALSDKY